MERRGICVAGNMTVDLLYPVTNYPQRGELVKILDNMGQTTGGAVNNVLGTLAHLDPQLPLYAVGRNGKDANGDYIMEYLRQFPNIDTSGVLREGRASFTCVMNDITTNERTFFTYNGASGSLSPDDVNFDCIEAKIFHIGYILLMDRLDEENAEYGTEMARLLHLAQTHGLKTSVDVVSETGDRFRRLVPPALKYTDYCIINELEAQQSTGIVLRDADGRLLRENMPRALQALKAMGVSTWAVIHAPEGGFGMDERNAFVQVASVKLPEGYVKGTVGAGDAFCAGVLCGAERGWTLRDAIRLGNAAAGCSLSRPDATGGVRPVAKALELYRVFGSRE